MRFLPDRVFRMARLCLGISLGFVLIVGTACSDEAELTPEQKNLFATWDIAKEIRKDFREKKSDELLALLSPGFAGRVTIKKHLETLFLGLEKTTLHLEMDSGIWDPQKHTVEYKAHWTFSGFVKKGNPRLFKTGECRIWVRMGEQGTTPVIEEIIGDNFLLMTLPSQKNGNAGAK